MPISEETKEQMIEYLLEDMRKKAGLTYDEVALAVYGEPLAQSRMKLYRLRKPKKDGSRKELTLEDFIKICRAVNLDPLRGLAVALDKFEA